MKLMIHNNFSFWFTIFQFIKNTFLDINYIEVRYSINYPVQLMTSLREVVKQAETSEQFKTRLKKYLFTLYNNCWFFLLHIGTSRWYGLYKNGFITIIITTKFQKWLRNLFCAVLELMEESHVGKKLRLGHCVHIPIRIIIISV